ncbi:MAG TPA: hypothetical protein VF556_00680 [Pyrinomonadaceae bacterium]|jgi:hypothetical protein
MENKGKTSSQDAQIQKLLGSFLPVRSSIGSFETQNETHLNEDSLAAFVEGNLNKRESQPILKHLVGCSFCRHITAELVKLDYAFAEMDEPQKVGFVKEAEPSKISEVLNGLLSRIFGANDGAVFAHQETGKEPEDAENSKEDK